MTGTHGRRNVVFVLVDQLNAAVLGCYGGPVDTPNIDRLANDGTRFTNAICPTPLCSPSRSSIETGRYPHSHGITSNIGTDVAGIGASDDTLGRQFSEAGYETYHYGRWHVGGSEGSYYDDTYTFDEYDAQMADAYDEVRSSGTEYVDWYGSAFPVERAPEFRELVESLDDEWHEHVFSDLLSMMGRLTLAPEDTFDAQVADRGVRRIEAADDDRPFLLTCSFNMPHDPNVAPSPYYETYDPDDVDLPETFGTFEDRYTGDWSRRIVDSLGEVGAREFLRIYFAMVDMIDDQVGRLLDALDERGIDDETVVCVTADHGDMAGEHGMVWKSTQSFYDAITRVPLVVYTPDADTGAVLDVPTDHTDLRSTLADAAGLSIPPRAQGESLLPFLRGERESSARRFAFCERIESGGDGRVVSPVERSAFMVRGRDWKYVRYHEDGDEYLYDLAADPGETTDCAGDRPDRLATMRSVLTSWLDRTDYPEAIEY